MVFSVWKMSQINQRRRNENENHDLCVRIVRLVQNENKDIITTKFFQIVTKNKADLTSWNFSNKVLFTYTNHKLVKLLPQTSDAIYEYSRIWKGNSLLRYTCEHSCC